MIGKILDAILVSIGAAILVSVLMIWFTNTSKNYRYTIDVEGRSNYCTNHYILNGGCVKFKDGKGDTMTVCGNYTIRLNK
jgi:hypothetical protein